AAAGGSGRSRRPGRRSSRPWCGACSDMTGHVVDAWMQHPSRAFLAHPMFDSLRRWSHDSLPQAGIPLEATIQAMDEAGVRLGLICAWWGPQGPLISNAEVASFVR